MGSKKTTKQIVKTGERMWENWYSILEARVRDLSNDTDHTLSWKDRAALNKGVTRRQIVTIYETAYSELAESFHGIIDRNKELERDLDLAKSHAEHSYADLEVANRRIGKLDRRVEGFLNVIESPQYE